MSSSQAVCESALEQAVISKNKEFLYKFVELQEDAQAKMISGISEGSVIPLLEVLTELFESKEMRYEVLLCIRAVLSCRRNTLKSVAVDVVKKEGNVYSSDMASRSDALKRILISISKEKVDLNKVYELKGRIAFVKEAIEEREDAKENVPVCREQ
ncbi:uncharacterized protein NEMAJ01_0644 [Nematocida major]|uniref:uncharacterized protein n=1 Tax=Nematocida major TaxID=1912982 RepID=UPI0020072A75|nr:uncharacterized protein NEMAJ01_0644 [Nematocida major]KAH9385748.1 hypothetical protein NEMAJ01_0644 [Nematocida major]